MKVKFLDDKSFSHIYSLFIAFTLLIAGVILNNKAMGQNANTAQSGKKEVNQLNILTPKEQKEGWQLLFDGKSTDAWTGTKGNGFPKKGWVIENGVLTVLGSSGDDHHASGGDIITIDQFGNFELSLEFKIPKGANSGIKYFVVNDFSNQRGNYLGQRGNYLGLEYQIIDDENHADAKLGVKGNRTLASLYDLIPAKNKKVKPVGEWNQAKIMVRGNHVEHWFNGRKVLEYERGSSEFRKLVAASKYKDLQDFGEMPAGHILLQGHGDTVHFRNIKIRKLANF